MVSAPRRRCFASSSSSATVSASGPSRGRLSPRSTNHAGSSRKKGCSGSFQNWYAPLMTWLLPSASTGGVGASSSGGAHTDADGIAWPACSTGCVASTWWQPRAITAMSPAASASGSSSEGACTQA